MTAIEVVGRIIVYFLDLSSALPTPSAGEAKIDLPRWRFGLVWGQAASLTGEDDSQRTARSVRAKWSRRWLIGYWLVLVSLTHWPNPWPPSGEPKYLDKVVHFSLYGTLAALALHALTVRAETVSVMVRTVGVLAAAMAFGLLDEATQPLTKRDFEWFDWLADGLGALTGVVAYNWWRVRGKSITLGGE